MIKWIYFIIILFLIPTSWWIYSYYQNQPLVEEDLAFSANFKNITRVYDTNMNLNFNTQQIMFSSKLQPLGNSIMINLHSRGFVDTPQSCDDNLFIWSKNGSEFPRVSHYGIPFQLNNYSPVDFLQIVETCSFQYTLVPNGNFVIQFFNQTQAQIKNLVVDNFTFTTLFDDKKYGCRETCIFTKQLNYYDSNPNDNTRTVIFNGQNIDERTINLSLRTYDKNFQLIADTSKAIFTGLIMAALGTGYDLLKNKPKKSIKWKKELRFFTFTYFTNGFTIGSFIVLATQIFKSVPTVYAFRTSLWYDQTFWIFLVPITAQVIFRLSKNPVINPAVKRVTKKMSLITFVFVTSSAFSILSYAFFFASILLIIPTDNPITRNLTIDFGMFTLMMSISGYLASFLSLILARTRKYYKDNNDVDEVESKIFNFENKVVIMSVLFSMSLIIFFIFHHR
ncbi:MAG: hypothetical protein ACYDAJ_07260 [Nitrosotalea sp.]